MRCVFLMAGIFFVLAQPSFAPGTSLSGNIVKHKVQADSVSRTFYAQYPKGTAPSSGWPVVFSFHGWRGSAESQAKYDGPLRTFGAKSAVIVHGEGWPTGGRWQSWHGGGSAGANADGGLDGQICEPSVAKWDWHCYHSCAQKGYCTTSGGGSNICRWSHCKDDVAATLGALEAVRTYLAKSGGSLDDSKVFATGDSNGALFIYELASDPRSAKIFSALAPVSGLPHNGFNKGTLNPKIRFLMIAGTKDKFVYPFPNVPTDPSESYGYGYGWYYSNWLNTTKLWAHQKSLTSSTNKTLYSSGHGRGLTCSGWSSDSTAEHADLATCFYVGSHDSPPNNARKMIWTFFGFQGEHEEQIAV